MVLPLLAFWVAYIEIIHKHLSDIPDTLHTVFDLSEDHMTTLDVILSPALSAEINSVRFLVFIFYSTFSQVQGLNYNVKICH